jgi:biopolymer transport protein ExbB
MLDLFYKGGPLMYPLLVGSVLMVAVVIERGFRFFGTGLSRKTIESVKTNIIRGDYEKAAQNVEGENSPVAEIIKKALEHRKSAGESIENELSIRGDEILRGFNRNLHLLELIGKIAPMIGLLGTVMGMVEAFQKMAFVRNLVDPSMLASGIWEALITTVAGLFVGIPALVFHHLYMNKVKAIAFSMKHIGEEIVTLIVRDRGGHD